MRLAAFLALLLVLAGCTPDPQNAALLPLAAGQFRADFGGSGKVEPWTARVPIDPSGGYVVREFRDVTIEVQPKAASASDSLDGIDWRGLVIVRYWSRIVEAPDWRGPALPTFWDQYAVAYPARRQAGAYILDRRFDS